MSCPTPGNTALTKIGKKKNNNKAAHNWSKVLITIKENIETAALAKQSNVQYEMGNNINNAKQFDINLERTVKLVKR